MFERIGRSWELVKASWAVLRSDRELIVFPIVSAIVTFIVALTFLIPSLAAGLMDAMLSDSGGRGILGYIVLFLFYLVTYGVVIFFNSALIGAALIRLRGGDPTLNDGLQIARAHLGQIIGYAAISATVGVLLRLLAERGGVIGQIASSLLGLAWSVATFLAVPVLVVEDVSPMDAIKRSTELLKRTWGEQIVGNFSISTIFGLAIFGVIILGAVLAAAFGAADAGALAILVIVVAVILVLALALISAALNGIFQAALYRYATDGDAGDFFDSRLIQGAFREKKKR